MIILYLAYHFESWWIIDISRSYLDTMRRRGIEYLDGSPVILSINDHTLSRKTRVRIRVSQQLLEEIGPYARKTLRDL